jgi:16S rRNA (cytosine1402-N4)-methyltransferase
MVEEAVTALLVEGAQRVVDGTVGTGGHAAELLRRNEHVQVLCLDRDGEVLDVARARLEAFGNRVILRRSSYAALDAVVDEVGWRHVDGILLDLGLSSFQLELPERGFSFMHAGDIDFRFSRSDEEPGSALIERLSERELGDLIFRFGEERESRAIAHAIKAMKPRTTVELAELVSRVKRRGSGRIHPATKTFQALRIAVNHELEHLERFLHRFLHVLARGGRAVIISYHSLEDRMVKQRFARLAAEGVGSLVARRALRPSPAEVARNRRSRSARLRVFRAG